MARDVPVGSLDRRPRAPKTAEVLAGRLRARIVRGDLRAGDSLPPEAQLLDHFGVSRPTLREAFRVLEAEGLLTVQRGSRGGARVQHPDLSVAARHVGLLLQLQAATLADVHQARTVTEPACARLLARRRTAQDLADLRQSTAALRELVQAGPDRVPDPLAWSRRAGRLPELVVQRCGSATLALQGGVLQDVVATHLAVGVGRYLSEPEAPAQFRRTLKSHERVIDLVEARDADGAEQHWRRHLEAAGRALLRDDLGSATVVDLFS